ncbi:DUF4339 domain-containing protein [Reichenbachiella sp. MALMAid0571]|uniref:DUF4339 domain-containing protein n=1 Tax=Reichenbachiella sp. MALMAid0571 TaxID=3143939 RepID=UPI0032DEAD03
MEQYFIIENSERLGPFSLDELKQKQMSKSTLVWTEKLDDWTEAKNLKELKDLIKVIPPPIPKPDKEPLKVEAKISKQNEKLISPKTEVAIAKETKSIFQQILYGLIIGTLSFPIFYFVIYDVKKYDDYDIKANLREDTVWGIDLDDFPFTWYGMNYASVSENIESRKEIYTEKSLSNSFAIFLIASGIFVVFRYISKGAIWVQETSKKNLNEKE